MNFYFLVCSALLSSVYQDRHIHTDTQTQPKWNKKRIFPQLLSIKLRSLRSYIYVFIQEFPIFDFMDNWKDLFSRSVWFFPGRCLPFVLWIMWQVNSDSDSLSHNKMSEITECIGWLLYVDQQRTSSLSPVDLTWLVWSPHLLLLSWTVRI